jgi:hypothetical protein
LRVSTTRRRPPCGVPAHADTLGSDNGQCIEVVAERASSVRRRRPWPSGLRPAGGSRSPHRSNGRSRSFADGARRTLLMSRPCGPAAHHELACRSISSSSPWLRRNSIFLPSATRTSAGWAGHSILLQQSRRTRR